MATISGQLETNRKGDRRGTTEASRANLLKGKGGRTTGSKNWETLLGLAGITDADETARIKALYAIAKNKKHPGCLKANEILNERRFGKVTQPLSDPDGSPLTVRVVYDRKARHAAD